MNTQWQRGGKGMQILMDDDGNLLARAWRVSRHRWWASTYSDGEPTYGAMHSTMAAAKSAAFCHLYDEKMAALRRSNG